MNTELWTHERLKPKKWKGEHAYYKQVKLNGHRFTVYKQANGKLVGFEREIRPDLEITVKRPKIVEYNWWKKLDSRLAPLSSVDGELHVPRGNAGDAAHAIAECLPELEFGIFAMPWLNGVDFSIVSPEFVQTEVLHLGLQFVPLYKLLETDNEERLLADARDLGIEGWVLKQSNYSGWWKVKPTRDIDVVVTGFKDGEGKYLGAVGALRVSIWTDGEFREIASVSGMDDDVRWDIDEKKDLGRVCEVRYQDVGNGGRLIHPRFVRWRDDKPADQCHYDKEDL
jgi:hypothetical protein